MLENGINTCEIRELGLEEAWKTALELRQKNRLTDGLSAQELLSVVWLDHRACLKKQPKNFHAYFKKSLNHRLRRESDRTRRAAQRRAKMKAYKQRKKREFLAGLRNDNEFIRDLLLEFIKKTVQEIPPDDSWLLTSLYWRNKSMRELSRETGIDDSHLNREHTRCLLALRCRIEREFWGWRKPNYTPARNGKRAA